MPLLRLGQVLDELNAAGVDARVGSGGGRMHMTMDRCARSAALRRFASRT
jgi:hypothetical protein